MSPGEYPDRDPQLFYELARDRHAAQVDALNSLDTKLAFFLTSSSALLGILVAIYALRPNAFDAPELGLLSASGLAWLVLTGRALNAFRHRAWRSGPKLPDVFDLHFSEDDARLKWRVANVFWHDYNYNKRHEDRKGAALTWALLLFVTQTVLLVAALVLVAAGSGSNGSSRHSECPAQAGRDASALAGSAPEGCLRVPESADLRHSSAVGSLTRHAASATVRARMSARDRRASIVRSA
jgi:hypothetical protein